MDRMGGRLIQAAAHFTLSQDKVFRDNNCCCAGAGRSALYAIVEPRAAQPSTWSYMRAAWQGDSETDRLNQRVGLD